MKSAPLPAQEERRLGALRDAGLLDTLPEQAWDDLARMASAICGAPIALVSLIDEHRQWFKARVGIDATETSRDLAFCAHAILEPGVFEVPDALEDDRFHDNPFVTGDPNVRFYAGAPIVTEGGDALGTVCVVDRTPRRLSGEQREALTALARQASTLVGAARRAGELTRWTTLVESTLESTADAICCLDRDSRVIVSNRRFIDMWGFSAADVRRGAPNPMEVKGLQRLVDPAAFQRAIAEQQEHPERDRADVFELLDGRTVERYSHPQRIGGVVVGRVNSFRDITPRRQIERMKDEFVSTVSHELRTPLTAIRGALGLLEGGVGGKLLAPAEELVTLARDNADRLIRLVNEILDLERLQAGRSDLRRQAVGAAGLMRSAADAVRTQAADAGVMLVVAAAPDLELEADPDRVVQVLINLVSNAVKFSPPQSRVEVRAAACGEGVRFEVADQGPGIPAGKRDKLFQRFQQLDQSDRRSRGGTGLGLAISKAIVEQHGGRIGVASEPGQGSTFWFELPAGRRSES